MGTKNNPGEFDCWNKLLPDEPYFVLMGRDPSAAAAVRAWVDYRCSGGSNGRGDPQTAEALAVANAMEDFYEQVWSVRTKPNMPANMLVPEYHEVMMVDGSWHVVESVRIYGDGTRIFVTFEGRGGASGFGRYGVDQLVVARLRSELTHDPLFDANAAARRIIGHMLPPEEVEES